MVDTVRAEVFIMSDWKYTLTFAGLPEYHAFVNWLNDGVGSNDRHASSNDKKRFRAYPCEEGGSVLINRTCVATVRKL